MQKPKAVFFDLDGTFIDSEKIHFDSWNEALAPHGIELNFDHYMKEYAGVSLYPNAERIKRVYKLDIPIDDFINRRQTVLIQKFRTMNIPLMPYSLEILDFLESQQIQVGMVTSSSRGEMNVILQRLNLEKKFPVRISRDDVKRNKPHPDPYQKGLCAFGINAWECIALEDSLSGVQSASAAGVTCLGIQCFEEERDRLSKYAEHVFASLLDAKEYMQTCWHETKD